MTKTNIDLEWKGRKALFSTYPQSKQENHVHIW
jgi:hypothetical protein